MFNITGASIKILNVTIKEKLETILIHTQEFTKETHYTIHILKLILATWSTAIDMIHAFYTLLSICIS